MVLTQTGDALATQEDSELSDIEVDGTRSLKPRPDILDALEKDYPIEDSVADLVDNSIDALATRVLIRLQRRHQRLVSLCVVDNGWGMDSDGIDEAMTFAARRKYGATDLGMFGVGLKTASLSHADTVTVVSRSKGSGAVGRQWTKKGIKLDDWSVNLVSPTSARALLDREWGDLGQIRVGTIVRWNKVYDFDRLRQGIDKYIQTIRTEISQTLGLKLHRFLERRAISIAIDVEDLVTGECGTASRVLPLNPFPPRDLIGAPGFPRTFIAALPGGDTLKLRSHLWKKKQTVAGYKLGGGKVAERQGLYLYRHDRLIQAGGWCKILGTNEPHLSLARVEVDIPDDLASYLRVRSSKNGVDVPVTFADSVMNARTAKKTGKPPHVFREYLTFAREFCRRKGELKAKPMLRPGDGLPADVKNALDNAGTPYLRGQEFSITWAPIRSHDFFAVDQVTRTVTLNQRYRSMMLRGARGGSTDVPLVRTLLYFVLEELLAGERLSKTGRLRLESMRAALKAALKAEERWANER